MTTQTKDLYAVILAGGSGTRFWPKSRQEHPKQLCRIGSSELTMIEQTLKRLDGFIPTERRIIVTHTKQAEKTRRIVGSACGLILEEPEAKNTAAALAMAALEIQQRCPTAVMLSLHADHVIDTSRQLTDCLQHAADVARNKKICLIGIPPTYAETGYGYIERGIPLENSSAQGYQVVSFREKPDQQTAINYLKTGHFLWNSGIFAWSIDTILSEFSKYLPETLTALTQVLAGHGSFQAVPSAQLSSSYHLLVNIPIDDAILEKSDRVAVIDATFSWQDVGSWAALAECFPSNAQTNLVYGDCITIDCERTTIDSDGPLIGAIGLKDMVVVAHKGAILVCPRERAQDVKAIVAELKEKGRNNWL